MQNLQNQISSFRGVALTNFVTDRQIDGQAKNNMSPHQSGGRHNFGKGLSALHQYAFGFSQTCVVVKKIFENWSFWGSFCPIPKAPGVQETWNLQFKCPLSQRCFMPNLKRIGLVGYQEEVKNVHLLTDDARRTTYDDGRRPIAIGHLSLPMWPKNL